MTDIKESDWFIELKSKIPQALLPLFDRRDGAARLARELSKRISPEDLAEKDNLRRAWELTGLFYLLQTRFHEALQIFFSLYDHLLAAQEKMNFYNHKGMPLVWISESYSSLNYPVLAKRYLMLTLCEDAIREKGKISPDTTGVYFRLVWGSGLPDSELKRYAKQIYKLSQNNPRESLFPEWILQELDQNWMTEFPAPKEVANYSINRRYLSHMMTMLGDGSGKNLERLADYILSCMPGCRTKVRQKSLSTDYDIVCSVDGLEIDFRSELGRYFVCECKDWKSPADFSTMAKFCRVLDSTKSKFGILFSKNGISGEGRTINADREQLKIFQDRGMIIVVIDLNDLKYLADGTNFINLLRTKYERVRLDISRGS